MYYFQPMAAANVEMRLIQAPGSVEDGAEKDPNLAAFEAVVKKALPGFGGAPRIMHSTPGYWTVLIMEGKTVLSGVRACTLCHLDSHLPVCETAQCRLPCRPRFVSLGSMSCAS